MRDRRTLLQRLIQPDLEAGYSDTASLEMSVRDNLSQLFVTQQGSAQAEPEFGLPNICTIIHSFDKGLEDDLYQHGIDQLKREIKQAIERFEPRLRLERLGTYVDPRDPYHLRFEIVAWLLVDKQNQRPFRLEASVNPHGCVEIA